MAYQPVPTQEEGAQKEVRSSDNDAIYLLQRILIQLKMANIHLSAISNIEIDEEDME
jgi:hypothetical protein